MMMSHITEASQHIAVIKGAGLEQRWLDRFLHLSHKYRDSESRPGNVSKHDSFLGIGGDHRHAIWFLYWWRSVRDLWRLTRRQLYWSTLVNQSPDQSDEWYSGIRQPLTRSKALHRVNDTLQQPNEASSFGDRPFEGRNASGYRPFRLNNLQFRHHPDIPLIEGWNLHIPAGQSLALVGASGCVKQPYFIVCLGCCPPQQALFASMTKR